MSNKYLSNLFGLDGQNAVVIGATGVLGGALAEGIAQAGASVVVAGRDASRGQRCVERIRSCGGKAGFLAVDVSSREAIQKFAEDAFDQYGKIDILVNCAGANSATPYEKIDEEDWRRILDANLSATHFGCQAFAPRMARQEHGGAILNIGSVTAHLPLSRVFAYSASKAAVVNLTKNLAREYAEKKVRVNVLCPGFFPAEQNRKILDAERVANIMAQTPMRRFGEPHELVGAVLLLVSRGAGSFITGAEIYVDGGFTAMRF